MKLLYILSLKHSTFDQSMFRIHAEYMGNKHDVYWVMPSSQKFGKSEIKWRNANVFLTNYSRKNLVLKILDNIKSLFVKFKISNRLIKEKQIEIIVARNDVFDSLLCFYFMKKYNLKYIFRYSFPVYEDLLFSAKHGKTEFPRIFSFLFGKFGNKIIHRVMNRCDLVVAMSNEMKKDLRKKGIKTKICIIPCGSRILKPLPSGDKIKKKYNLKYPTLIYIGSLYKLKGVEIIIDIFNRLKDNGIIFNAIIAGSGSGKAELERLIKKLRLDKQVYFTGRYGLDEGHELICAADIGLSPFPPLPVFKTASPAKLMDYLACSKPVVGSNIPDQKYVLKQSGGGICVEHNVNEFVKAIIWLIKHREKAEQMGKKGREWIKKNRTYEIHGKKFEQICSSLLR